MSIIPVPITIPPCDQPADYTIVIDGWQITERRVGICDQHRQTAPRIAHEWDQVTALIGGDDGDPGWWVGAHEGGYGHPCGYVWAPEEIPGLTDRHAALWDVLAGLSATAALAVADELRQMAHEKDSTLLLPSDLRQVARGRRVRERSAARRDRAARVSVAA